MNGAPFPVGRFRFVLVVASVAALIFASLAVAAYNEGQYRLQTTQAARVQALVLAETVAAALSFSDDESLREYVDALRANTEVEAVGVYDEDGRFVAGYGLLHPLPGQVEGLKGDATEGQVAVTEPVTQKRARLGTVYIRLRTEGPLRRAARYVGPGLLVLMASMMFAVMGLDYRRLMRANRALNAQMAEREKAEAALRQSQKMEAIGRLTGGVAHDFNNMLAVVLGSLDLLVQRFPDADPKLLRYAHNAMAGGKRAADLTKRLLAFSRLQPLNPKAADVGRSIADMSDLLNRTLGEDVAVETRAPQDLWRAHIDVSQLETAILNLAINARDAMPGGGRLIIETSNVRIAAAAARAPAPHDDEELAPGDYVLLEITDTGTGIEPAVLAKVFDPFFTTKPVGQGTGLGLSQVHGFINQSGGHIRISSEVGHGTSVRLYLPRSTEPLSEPPAVVPPDGRRRHLTVLVAEDEDGVREFAAEALGQLGYDVVAAANGPEALALLEQHADVSILLTDVVMPGMNGRQLADQALRRSPALKVVFMTGYTHDAIVHNGVVDAGTHLVSKPFTLAQLDAELEAALA
ncbi:MAG: response regulator [Caulobacteraceae bacterium]|nr:response regulator [Caulobacteraceae bacterium]